MITFLIIFFVCIAILITLFLVVENGFVPALLTGVWVSFWASLWLMLIMVGIKYLSS